MPDREKTITHLQIIQTWAEVGRKYGDGIQGNCLRDVIDWLDDALALLKGMGKGGNNDA